MSEDTTPKPLRRPFLIHLLDGIKVVWPILAAIIGVMVALGRAILRCSVLVRDFVRELRGRERSAFASFESPNCGEQLARIERLD
jgi:hypothetical protein